MKRYLLDTGPLGAWQFARPPAVPLIQPWIANQEAATSLLVYGEVVEHIAGWSNAATIRQNLLTLLKDVTPIELSLPILDRYADLRRSMRPPHGSGLIGDIDTLIAATALEHDLTVVTIDGDFTRVPSLKFKLLAPRTFALIRTT